MSYIPGDLTKYDPTSRLNPKETALLVVDYQKFYLEKDQDMYMEHAAKDGPKLNAFCQAMKDAGCLLIYVQCSHALMRNNFYTHLYPEQFDADGTAHLRPGTRAFEVSDDITVVPDYYVAKDRWDGFYMTNLELILNNWEIKNVAITGLATHTCSLETACSAVFRGYDTTMITDLNWAVWEPLQNITFESFKGAYGTAMSSEEYLARLK